jgi:uncharacterized membrane protein SirB2
MEKTTKILSIVQAVLMLISAILIISLMNNIDEAGMETWIDTNLNWTYVLFGFSAVAAVLFSIVHTFTDKESAKKGLMGIGFLGLIAVISFNLATSAIPEFYGVEKFVNNGVLTNESSQWIGASLYAMYILFGGAILSIVYSSLSRLWR